MTYYGHHGGSIIADQMKRARQALNRCAALEHEGYIRDLPREFGYGVHITPREWNARMRWHQEWVEYGSHVGYLDYELAVHNAEERAD